MFSVLPQDNEYLRDAFGCALGVGACVLDADPEVGHVRLELSSRRGPASAYRDGWFTVTRTGSDRSLSGKVMTGRFVQLIGGAT